MHTPELIASHIAEYLRVSFGRRKHADYPHAEPMSRKWEIKQRALCTQSGWPVRSNRSPDPARARAQLGEYSSSIPQVAAVCVSVVPARRTVHRIPPGSAKDCKLQPALCRLQEICKTGYFLDLIRLLAAVQIQSTACATEEGCGKRIS